MDTELYKTIEKLKETLAGVASARQQVGDTVAAYSRAQKDVQAFVGQMRNVEASLTRVVGLLQVNGDSLARLSDGVAEDFKGAADKAAADAARAVGDAAASAAGQMGDASALFKAQVDSCASSLASLSDSVRHAADSSVAGLGGVAARFDGQIAALSAQAEALRSEAGKVCVIGETVDGNARSLSDISAAVGFLRTELTEMRRELSAALSAQAEALRSEAGKVCAIGEVADGNARSLSDISAAVGFLRTELTEMRREQSAALSALRDEVRAGKRIGVAALVVALLSLVFLVFLFLAVCGFASL